MSSSVFFRESPPSATTIYTKFLIDPDGARERIESVLTKNHKVPTPSPVIRFILDDVKPYKGGDADILALHLLNIDDKHRLLVPTVVVVGINGLELQNENGTVDRFDIALTRPNFYRQTVTFGAKFKNHGELAFHITFRKGTPAEDLEVIPTLHRFAAKVEEIVLRLRTMV